MSRSLRLRPARGISLLIQSTKDREVDNEQHVLIRIEGLNNSSPIFVVRGHRTTTRAASKEQVSSETVKRGFRFVGVFGDGRESGRNDDFAVLYEGLSEEERKIKELEAKQKELGRRKGEAVRQSKRNADVFGCVLEDESPRKKNCVDGVEKSEVKAAKSEDSSSKKKTTEKVLLRTLCLFEGLTLTINRPPNVLQPILAAQE